VINISQVAGIPSAMRGETTAHPFVGDVTLALELSGFTQPKASEARVVLFDSARWLYGCAEANALLCPREHKRAQRFHHRHHHDTYVLAHACWRVVLGAVLGVDARDVPLVNAASGQPMLPGTSYATSLSHSGTHVAIAIAMDQTVGVDIERSPPRNGLQGLVDVLCSPSEATAINALPLVARGPALLAMWTRKEALLKAFGVGLRETPTAIVADTTLVIEPPPSAAGAPACRVRPLDLPQHLVGALATPVSVTTHSLHWLNPPIASP
jgi:4'-phosphopantetheinyl transferase